MVINALLDQNIKHPLVGLLIIFLIATFWYIEKTKKIPQYGMLLYKMGMQCSEECGQKKQLQYFQKAVRYTPELNDTNHYPELSDAHYRSAHIYKERGDDIRSLGSLVKATELYPNPMAYYKAGLHYFNEDAYENARRYFLKCLDIRIGCPGNTNYYLAKIYDQKKEYNSARFYFHEVISIYPEYADEIFPRLAELYFLLDQEVALLRATSEYRKYQRDDLADQLERNFKAVQALAVSD